MRLPEQLFAVAFLPTQGKMRLPWSTPSLASLGSLAALTAAGSMYYSEILAECSPPHDQEGPGCKGHP